MDKFDEFAKSLGWTKPFEDVLLWHRQEEDIITAVFDINNIYDSCNIYPELTEDLVQRSMQMYPATKFKEESKEWILLVLASDFFAHKRDYENELIWAKKAMALNPKLTNESFSNRIKELL